MHCDMLWCHVWGDGDIVSHWRYLHTCQLHVQKSCPVFVFPDSRHHRVQFQLHITHIFLKLFPHKGQNERGLANITLSAMRQQRKVRYLRSPTTRIRTIFFIFRNFQIKWPFKWPGRCRSQAFDATNSKEQSWADMKISGFDLVIVINKCKQFGQLGDIRWQDIQY